MIITSHNNLIIIDLTMDMMMITGEKSRVMISIIQMILTMIPDSIIMIILQGLTHYLHTKEMEEIIMTLEEEVHILMMQVEEVLILLILMMQV